MGSLISQSPTLLLSSSTYLTAQLILPNLLSSTISPTKTLTTRDHHLLSNKVIGAFHSILSGGLALYLVTLPKWTEQDLIDTKSEIGDGIVALELGYLVSDTVALLRNRRRLNDPRLVKRVVTHHIVVGSLLGWYLNAAARGKAKGIFFVASYIIMNLSTPPRYLTWYLTKYTRASRRVISGVHGLALAIYATVRVGLLYYQLWVYGQRKGLSALEAFNTLPMVCRGSTTILLLINGIRFAQLSGLARHKVNRG